MVKTNKRVLKVFAAGALLLSCATVNVGKELEVVNAADEYTYNLVTDVADLTANDVVVVAAKNSAFALSTTQNKNNRGQTAVTKDENELTNVSSDVQLLTLEAGNVSGTFAFNTGSGYLYAASSNSNHLKTEATLSDNSSWTIEIATNGVATIKAQGTNTRNWLKHNASSSIFSCYGSGQADIVLYERNLVVDTGEPSLKIEHDNKNLELGNEYNITSSYENMVDPTITWESSNTNIATVEDGKLTLLALGSFTVTANTEYNGNTYTDSLTFSVWPNTKNSLTIGDALNIPTDLFTDSVETSPYSYSLSGTITEITASTVTFTDGTNSISAFKPSFENNEVYVIGDECTFTGAFSTYYSNIQMYQPTVVINNGVKTVFFNTATELGFSANYTTSVGTSNEEYSLNVSSLTGLTSGSAITGIDTNNTNLSISISKGDGSTNPAYYTDEIRLYKNNEITFSSTTATISEIIISCSSSSRMGDPTSNVETATIGKNGTDISITNINSNSITINSNSTNITQLRFTDLIVKYTVDGGTLYNFSSFDNYSMRFSTTISDADVARILEDGETAADLTYGALIVPTDKLEGKTFEEIYTENNNVDFVTEYTAKDITLNYTANDYFGAILNGIPTTDTSVSAVIYVIATDGTYYFANQTDITVKGLVDAYMSQLNSLGLDDIQIKAVEALYDHLNPVVEA